MGVPGCSALAVLGPEPVQDALIAFMYGCGNGKLECVQQVEMLMTRESALVFAHYICVCQPACHERNEAQKLLEGRTVVSAAPPNPCPIISDLGEKLRGVVLWRGAMRGVIFDVGVQLAKGVTHPPQRASQQYAGTAGERGIGDAKSASGASVARSHDVVQLTSAVSVYSQ